MNSVNEFISQVQAIVRSGNPPERAASEIKALCQTWRDRSEPFIIKDRDADRFTRKVCRLAQTIKTPSIFMKHLKVLCADWREHQYSLIDECVLPSRGKRRERRSSNASQ